MTPNKPRRRWLRYSLRSLLLVTLALSIWLGWMANQAARQRRAVELVEELGGWVQYDCQKTTTPTGYNSGITGDDFYYTSRLSEDVVYTYVGHDLFHDVIMVHLWGPSFTDAHVRQIVDGLPNTLGFDLNQCRVSDDGIESLASLDRLEWVYLYEPSDVTAQGSPSFGAAVRTSS